jgi:hypothetical protein
MRAALRSLSALGLLTVAALMAPQLAGLVASARQSTSQPAPPASAAPQGVNPDLLRERWTAHWIRPGGAPPTDFGVYHFRKTFTLGAVPRRFVVHVTADNRYELFVNGQRAAAGPARGDLDHWRFESVDIASKLKAGSNLIAAVVWNFAGDAPMAQVTYETGFLLQGDTKPESAVNTDSSWRAVRNDAISLVPVDRASIFNEYYAAAPGEQVDASKYPWGWEAPEFDDSAWGGVEEISIGGPRGIRDTPSRWFLVPSTIPPMEDTPGRFARVARSEGAEPPAGLVLGSSPWTIAAHTTAHVLLDRAHLTSAYPELVTTGGRGASIAVTYTEALHEKTADGSKGAKGNRNEIEGKIATGLRDRFLPDGGRGRLFRPLWWRTYRYVDLEIQTAEEPLTIDDLRASFSAYPFEAKASFESDDPVLSNIWEVGWRTARLCAHETYMDTPYWEQLQYVGDTRIQALISLYVTGDDRLVRNAIELYDESRFPDGLTQSRYPTMLPQVIPPFSLFWIGMMHDLYEYSGDPSLVRRYLHGAAAVLDWFADRRAPSGVLGRLEWWNFVDWVDGHGFQDGEPPSDNTGESAILSLQFVLALREAADLESAVGSADTAARYRTLADRVAASVHRTAWEPGRQLFADTTSRKTFSQHVNALAILADLVPEADREALMKRVLTDRSLTQATYYFRFYVFRAMKKAGLGDEYLAQLGPWRTMLDLGLTTWAETPEPTRSDSHAWSAHPNYDLLTTVAGIEPATPGFGQVRIAPHLGALTSVKASVPTPKGLISVKYQRKGGVLTADVTLPGGMTGAIAWKGREVPLHPGTQRVVQ